MRAILFQSGASQSNKPRKYNLSFDCMIKWKITVKQRMPSFHLF